MYSAAAILALISIAGCEPTASDSHVEPDAQDIATPDADAAIADTVGTSPERVFPGPCSSLKTPERGEVVLTLSTYDADERLVERTTDSGADGTAEVFQRFDYPTDNQQSRTVVRDGEVWRRELQEFDDDGRPLWLDFAWGDSDPLERSITWTYDDLGNLTSRLGGPEGAPTSGRFHENSYDDNDRLSSWRVTHVDESMPDEEWFLEYEGPNDQPNRMWARQADGRMFALQDNLYTYDDQDRLIRREYWNGDFRPQEPNVETWSFDAAGNLLRETRRTEGEAYVILHSYECWDD